MFLVLFSFMIYDECYADAQVYDFWKTPLRKYQPPTVYIRIRMPTSRFEIWNTALQ